MNNFFLKTEVKKSIFLPRYYKIPFSREICPVRARKTLPTPIQQPKNPRSTLPLPEISTFECLPFICPSLILPLPLLTSLSLDFPLTLQHLASFDCVGGCFSSNRDCVCKRLLRRIWLLRQLGQPPGFFAADQQKSEIRNHPSLISLGNSSD